MMVRERHSPLDHRVGQPPRLVVYIDEQLPRRRAIREGENSAVAFQACGDDIAWCKSLMHRIDRTHRRPYLLRRGGNPDFLANTRHVAVLCLLKPAVANRPTNPAPGVRYRAPAPEPHPDSRQTGWDRRPRRGRTPRPPR